MERLPSILALSLVLAVTLMALFGSPVTTGQFSLVVSNGYDSKTGQTLSVSGDLTSLQGSDDNYFAVEPQSYLVLQFSDVSSASGGIKRARLIIEHKEDYSTKSSLVLLSVGTGLSDPNTSFIWSSLKMPRRAKEQTDSFDISKYVNSVERANNLELRIFNKNPSSSIEVDRVYIQIDFAETAQSLPSNQNPIALFTASPDSGNTPLAVTFDASSSSDPDGIIGTYAWNFGDSSSSFGKIVTHTYQNTGTYTATLKAYDNLGASSTVYKSITVSAPSAVNITNQNPIASFTASPTSGFAPLTVSLDASSSFDPDGTITSYNWDFNVSGVTATGKTTSITYSNVPNIYNITLTVTDNSGATSKAVKQINVTIAPFGTAFFLVSSLYGNIFGSPSGGKISLSPPDLNNVVFCSSSCELVYPFGATVSATAIPDSNMRFIQWSYSECRGSTQQTCTVTLNVSSVAKSASASFGPANINNTTIIPIQISTLNGSTLSTSAGKILLSPADTTGNSSCTGLCHFNYPAGMVVTATPVPLNNMYFIKWYPGGCSGTTQSSCTITVDNPIELQGFSASFSKLPAAIYGICKDVDGDDIYTASYAYINISATSTGAQYDICKNGTNYNMVEGVCVNNQPLGEPKSCPSGYACQTIKTINKIGVGACVAQNATTNQTNTTTGA